jgi:hypothetical protein
LTGRIEGPHKIIPMSSHLNEVDIIVSSEKTGDTYRARSYPHTEFYNLGDLLKIRINEAPVYKVYLKAAIKTKHGPAKIVTKEWKALRFMPFYNDPKHPNKLYKDRGWLNSGRHQVHKKAVTNYNPDYVLHNRHSDFFGAIQIDGGFLVHAGPADLSDDGYGSAGCVEIIGNFDDFKKDIRELSGSHKEDEDDVLLQLVKARRLYVQVDYAVPPDLRKNPSFDLCYYDKKEDGAITGIYDCYKP